MNPTRYLSFSLPFAALLLAACGASSGHDTAPAAGKSITTASSPYSYKFLVKGTDGSTQQVNVVPRAVANAAGLKAPAIASTVSSQSAGKALDTTVTVKAAEADPPATIYTAPPATLLAAAAGQCGMVPDNSQCILHPNNNGCAAAGGPPTTTDPALLGIAQQEQNGQTITQDGIPIDPPWNVGVTGPAYYLFNNPPFYCDMVLEYEETLVCIADQLAQLADTVGPLTWYAPLAVGLFGGQFTSTTESEIPRARGSCRRSRR